MALIAENNTAARHFAKVGTTNFSSSWFVVDQAVRIALDESAQPEFAGQMIELSTAGVRLRIDRPLSPGTALALSWNDTALSGEVRKCITAGRGFLVECGLQHVVRLEEPNQKAAALSV